MIFFLYIIIYTPNITKGIKKISVNEIRYFILENYYKRIGFSKKNSYYLMKCQKTIIVAYKQINRKNN